MSRIRRRIFRAISVAATLGVVLLVCLAFGVFAGSRRSTTIAGATADAPRLLHVAGWRGAVGDDERFLHALRDGGCPHSMETFDWTAGHNGVAALWYAQRSVVPAQQLAARIEAIARESPSRPIDLTADSAGCGVTLAALARLPADVHVRTILLSSPAVSCNYDLAPALAHVNGKLISFRSDRDWFILGLGTWLFGTVDGCHASGAGRYGFTSGTSKLTQIDYDAGWGEAFGNAGGHSQTLGPRFARGYVAPLLIEASRETGTMR